MSNFCINYLFDKHDTLFILQFTRGDQTGQDLNKLVSCTKTVIASQREEEEGEIDVNELDRTPVILFTTDVDTMKSDINVLASRNANEVSTEKCKRLAKSGPREIMAEVMAIYIKKCTLSNKNELQYTGTVMKFEGNNAALYQGEPQVAREIEMLVTMFFPEFNSQQEAKVEIVE